MELERMKSDEILWRLQTALETITPMRGQLESDITEETAFITGQALGALHQAITLVKRDILAQKKPEKDDA
jgi:hypothetical protein